MKPCACISPWWYAKVSMALLLVSQAVYAVTATSTLPLLLESVPIWVGQATIAFGAMIVILHYSLLKRSSTNIAEPQRLVTTGGLFPLVRHPMYLGDFIVIVGLGLFFPTAVSLVAVGIATVALARLAEWEDRQMAERFPGDFAAYRNRSRRLVPLVF